jgi:hypothetical protein
MFQDMADIQVLGNVPELIASETSSVEWDEGHNAYLDSSDVIQTQLFRQELEPSRSSLWNLFCYRDVIQGPSCNPDRPFAKADCLCASSLYGANTGS